ncbi:MAG: hypothetical protein ACRC9V_04600 [Aeromonas sp.]
MPKEAVLPELRIIEQRLLKNPEQALHTKQRLKGSKLHAMSRNYNQMKWKELEKHGTSPTMWLHILATLLAILLCFRGHSTAISSDIRGMFHQVRLLPDNKSILCFLWRDLIMDKTPDVYQWQVLPFGTTCSPCCATFALQSHVLDHSQPDDLVREIIEKSFYVDNCLRSQDDAKDVVDKLSDLLAVGGE